MAVDTLSPETQEKYKDSPLWKPWMKDIRLRQLTSLEELEEFLESGEDKQEISWDVETSSLDPEPTRICGHCLAFDGNEGVYIPVRHETNAHYNLDPEEVLSMILKAMESRIVVVFNWMYEGEILRRLGIKRLTTDNKVKDVFIYNWLYDSSAMKYNLKLAAEVRCGLEMITIREVPGIKLDSKKAGKINFALSDPGDATLYAAADPVMAFRVLNKVSEIVESEQAFILKIEHHLLEPIFEMQQNPVMIERSFLQTCVEDLDRWISRMTADILAIAGYEFNIGSPAKVADFLEAQGVELPRKRETGKRETGAKAIEKLAGQFPVVDQILLYRSLVKERSSYVEPLLLNTTEDEPYGTFKFKSVGAPTGRLASGGVEEGDIKFMPLNAQCLSLETLVLRKDGIVKLGDLKEGDEIWDGERFSSIEGPFYSKKVVFNVELETGLSVKASQDHLFYAATENQVDFIPLRGISAGDWVAVNAKEVLCGHEENMSFTTDQGLVGLGPRRRIIQLNCTSKDFWEIYGFALGDGFLKNEKGRPERGFHFVFGWHEGLLREYIKKQLESFGYPTSEGRGKKDGYQDVLLLKNETYAGAEVFTRFGFLTGARNKTLPQAIYNAGRDSRRAFLRGLFSADGGDGKKGSSVRYKTVSESLARGVQVLLTSLGFVSSLKLESGYGWRVIPWDKEKFFKEIGFLGEKQVRVKNQSFGRWSRRKLERIPRGLRKKVLVEFLGNRSKRVYGTGTKVVEGQVVRSRIGYSLSSVREVTGPREGLQYFWLKVKEITRVGIEEVGDIYVPGSNRFCANGMIVHNSIPSANKYALARCRKVNNPPTEEMDAKLESQTLQTTPAVVPEDEGLFGEIQSDPT